MSEHSEPLFQANCAHSDVTASVGRSVGRSLRSGLRVLVACPRAGMWEDVRSVTLPVVLPGRPFRYQHAVIPRMPSTGEGMMEAAHLTGLREGQARPPVIYHRRPFGSRCSVAALLTSIS